MVDLSLKEEFISPLPLENLRKELAELEAGSFVDFTDEELRDKIRLIHTGFTFNAPIYPAGTLIYRAVRVTEPSVAMWLLADNIAIFPSEVDRKLNLFEVILLTIDSITVTPAEGGGTKTAHSLKTYDYARADEAGNLLWGQTSQIVYPPGITPPAIEDLAKGQ
jgi:hypothetical protein